MTLRRRLALAAAGAVALAIACASVVVYVSTRAELRGQVDDSLRATAPDVRLIRARLGAEGPGAMGVVGGPGGTTRVQRVEVPLDPLGGATGFAQAVTEDGDVLATRQGV